MASRAGPVGLASASGSAGNIHLGSHLPDRGPDRRRRAAGVAAAGLPGGAGRQPRRDEQPAGRWHDAALGGLDQLDRAQRAARRPGRRRLRGRPRPGGRPAAGADRRPLPDLRLRTRGPGPVPGRQRRPGPARRPPRAGRVRRPHRRRLVDAGPGAQRRPGVGGAEPLRPSAGRGPAPRAGALRRHRVRDPLRGGRGAALRQLRRPRRGGGALARGRGRRPHGRRQRPLRRGRAPHAAAARLDRVAADRRVSRARPCGRHRHREHAGRRWARRRRVGGRRTALPGGLRDGRPAPRARRDVHDPVQEPAGPVAADDPRPAAASPHPGRRAALVERRHPQRRTTPCATG